MSGIQLKAPPTICPFCRETVDVTSQHYTCQHCLSRHHVDCWEQYGACSVFGCHSPRYLAPVSDAHRAASELAQLVRVTAVPARRMAPTAAARPNLRLVPDHGDAAEAAIPLPLTPDSARPLTLICERSFARKVQTPAWIWIATVGAAVGVGLALLTVTSVGVAVLGGLLVAASLPMILRWRVTLDAQSVMLRNDAPIVARGSTRWLAPSWRNATWEIDLSPVALSLDAALSVDGRSTPARLRLDCELSLDHHDHQRRARAAARCRCWQGTPDALESDLRHVFLDSLRAIVNAAGTTLAVQLRASVPRAAALPHTATAEVSREIEHRAQEVLGFACTKLRIWQLPAQAATHADRLIVR